MSDSVRPHRRQPTRLPHPWDSPGKNTGVGCHFLLQCIKVKSESEVTQSCPTLSNPMDCSPPGFSIHGIFQSKLLDVPSDGKESSCNVGDLGSISGLGRFPGVGHGNPFQYFCLENPHGRRGLASYSPWVAKSRTHWETKHTQHHQNPTKIFVDLNKLILKFIWKGKRPRIIKQYWRRGIQLKDWYYTMARITIKLL